MRFSRILLLALLGVLISAPVMAESKIAVVEVKRLLQEAPQVEAIKNKLKKEFARRDEELVAQQKQLQQLEEKLKRDGAIMSSDELRRLEKDIITRKRKIKNSRTAFQEDLSLRQQEELSKLRKVISEVIVEVAKSDDLDAVFEAGVVYASDKVNITDKVLSKLKSR